jgi:catechol 2,3-dioxygenase-like lactoylglutathione lyase family enzyme
LDAPALRENESGGPYCRKPLFASAKDIAMHVKRTTPILRIFSVEKAREFHVDFLGFSVDWEHRFGDEFPLYMQVSREGLVLHLSEHHGDASPGGAVFVDIEGLAALHAELTAKNYRYLKPGIEAAPWGARVMKLLDPFGNRIVFNEANEAAAT